MSRRHAVTWTAGAAAAAALSVLLPLPASPLLPAVHAAPVPLPKKVLVVGATGATGRRLVAQLASAGVAVRAGVRDVKKAQGLGLALTPSVELVQCDVTAGVDALVAAIGDADAVVCATGFTPSFNFAKDNAKAVDGQGTRDLVDAAKRAGCKRFLLVTSLLTNAPAIGQGDNPNYKFLNAIGGILDEKRGSELYLQSSGLDYTIVRPGGLSNDPPSVTGAVIVGKADAFFGLPTDPGREISRDSVAQVCVQALRDSNASNKIVEIVASPEAPATPAEKWFDAV
jgi:uncharacterized protein YbjT (DUF2867 family)